MTNTNADDLYQRLLALPPEERFRLAALLRQTPVPAMHLGTNNQIEHVTTGDVAGRDLAKLTLSDDARLNGVAVALNLGTIIYGRDPREDERRRVAWYLAALANDLRRLPLRGLDATLGEGQGLDMTRVYVLLATTVQREMANGTRSQLKRYFEAEDGDVLVDTHHPALALPDQAVVAVLPVTAAEGATRRGSRPRLRLMRQHLATEAVSLHPRLVLLGDPGSGKSTFVRHLAWVLARRGLDQTGPETTLLGWEDSRRLLPIILPLRRLAGALASAPPGSDPAATVVAALRERLTSFGVNAPDDLLSESLVNGAALLLLDGLDEVPLEKTPTSANRMTTLRAVRALAERYVATPMLLTCRSRAYSEELRACLGWPSETLAPFTMGQVRHFVPAWYGELRAAGQLSDDDQVQRLSADLIATIADSPRLRTMAETPLLLTMMALLLARKGSLPRDRPRLYAQVLELLLGQWDVVRDGASLAEVLGRPDWTSERLRPLLDRLAFTAHQETTSADGRGRLERGQVRDALIDFFEAASVTEPWEAARRCLDYMEHRSGLLVPDGPTSYVFAHLTLQEHCAGQHLLLSRDAVPQLLSRRGDDRWREPIFLGLGVIQDHNPERVEKVLRVLIERQTDGTAKPDARWYHDLILAAELGQDRDWAYLRQQGVDVAGLQALLRSGLVTLLNDARQPLPAAERIRAGFLLGDLGDPRFPVTPEEWRRELARAEVGDTSGYFCRVEAGTYWIGSADNDPEATDEEKPRHQVRFAAPFYIARYPITNAQWQAWGEQSSRYANDSDLNRANQPVVGLTWEMTNTCCTWLSAQVGTMVRLPTEQEWEAAARGGDTRRYPWGDDWRDDHGATSEDQDTRGWRWSVPVGCYPAGAAPNGALDMAGNVWARTASTWQSYPGAEQAFTEDDWRVLRGGAYTSERTSVRCGARHWYRLHYDFDSGFRVVVAPSLAHKF